MATLVCLHAHPDDEAIATGGTMALAARAGHRVVLVCATDGSQGEVADGVLGAGESLAERRAAELAAAAELLGVHRVDFLGYRDSGMAGEASNDHPASFWQADVEEAASKLAELLTAEQADVLTCYDAGGGYGHPDHIQVHRVGHRAAALAGTARVYEATINRDSVRELMEMAEAAAEDGVEIADAPEATEAEQFGVPDAEITTYVDVSSVIGTKREAMRAHASQIGPDSFFLALPDDVFAAAFGVEWFIRADSVPAGAETWVFDS